MTTLTVKLAAICTGGHHLTFSVSGDRAATVHAVLDDLLQPITQEDIEAFCKVVTRMAKVGRTMNQARTLLQNGVTVSI